MRKAARVAPTPSKTAQPNKIRSTHDTLETILLLYDGIAMPVLGCVITEDHAGIVSKAATGCSGYASCSRARQLLVT